MGREWLWTLLCGLLARPYTAQHVDDWRANFEYPTYDLTVRSGKVHCYEAFYSSGCGGRDGPKATCRSCQGTACYKIGGVDQNGVEAWNYGCVERYTSSTSDGCVGTENAGGIGIACYCHRTNFCNTSPSLPRPPLALPLSIALFLLR